MNTKTEPRYTDRETPLGGCGFLPLQWHHLALRSLLGNVAEQMNGMNEWQSSRRNVRSLSVPTTASFSFFPLLVLFLLFLSALSRGLGRGTAEVWHR